MSDFRARPWSHDPNAPKITQRLYFVEKAVFAGPLIGAVLYGALNYVRVYLVFTPFARSIVPGIVTILFFQCMGALLNPTNRTRGSTKLGLMTYTAVMFSLATINIAINLDIQSMTYVDDRGSPNVRNPLGSGPLEYQFLISTKAIDIVPTVILFFNNWLADGLLLYRCSVIYTMNHWLMGFPYLMYLGSLGMGIAFIYQISTSPSATFLVPLFAIGFSLNVLLTLMIVARLILHSRKIRNAFGAPTEANRLYKAVATMLIESCALYAINLLLYFALFVANNPTCLIFFQAIAETQVIATFLIILRVANRSPLTSQTITGSNNSIHFRRQGNLTGRNELLSDTYPMSPMGTNGKTTGEIGVGVGATIYTKRSKESLKS